MSPENSSRKSAPGLGAAFLTSAFLLLVWTAPATPQAKPAPASELPKIYERLLKQIDQIPIYDNHSHASFADDSDMDAMAAPPGESSVLRLSDTNPEFV